MAGRNRKPKGVLIVVPCGSCKVWDKSSDAGATAACDAYRGAPFKVNREYAESFKGVGGEWVILSAKYGFIAPSFRIPGPYEVTFKQKSSCPVNIETLRRQIRQQHLDHFETVIGLGGKEYRAALKAAFSDTSVELQFPFAGLPIGKAMQAAKESARTRLTSRGVSAKD